MNVGMNNGMIGGPSAMPGGGGGAMLPGGLGPSGALGPAGNGMGGGMMAMGGPGVMGRPGGMVGGAPGMNAGMGGGAPGMAQMQRMQMSPHHAQGIARGGMRPAYPGAGPVRHPFHPHIRLLISYACLE